MPRIRLATLALPALAGWVARVDTDPPVTVRMPGVEVIIGVAGMPGLTGPVSSNNHTCHNTLHEGQAF